MRLQRQGRATPVQAVYSGWGGAMLLARALLKKRTFFLRARQNTARLA